MQLISVIVIFHSRRLGQLLGACPLREVREPPEACRVTQGQDYRERWPAGSLSQTTAIPPKPHPACLPFSRSRGWERCTGSGSWRTHSSSSHPCFIAPHPVTLSHSGTRFYTELRSKLHLAYKNLHSIKQLLTKLSYILYLNVITSKKISKSDIIIPLLQRKLRRLREGILSSLDAQLASSRPRSYWSRTLEINIVSSNSWRHKLSK